MPIALDYTSRIGPAALQAAGATVVCRYLSWLYRYGGQTHSTINPKIIQKAEYDELAAAGVQVVLNWEYDAHDWMGGSPAGLAHAAEAVRQARLLGHPPGAVIAGSADFDMARDDWSAAAQSYAQAFADVVTGAGYRAGAYGPWDVLAWLAGSVPAVTWYWQAGMSTSWSGGRNAKPWPSAHLRQRGTKTVDGVSGDWNEILIPWEVPMSAHSDDILGRWSQGFPTLSDGTTELTPVTWRVRDEAWQQKVDAALAELKAAQQPTITLTADQVDRVGQMLAAALPGAIAQALRSLTLKAE